MCVHVIVDTLINHFWVVPALLLRSETSDPEKNLQRNISVGLSWGTSVVLRCGGARSVPVWMSTSLSRLVWAASSSYNFSVGESASALSKKKVSCSSHILYYLAFFSSSVSGVGVEIVLVKMVVLLSSGARQDLLRAGCLLIITVTLPTHQRMSLVSIDLFILDWIEWYSKCNFIVQELVKIIISVKL